MSTLITSKVELSNTPKYEVSRRPNQYFVALWLNEKLTTTVINLVQVLSELSFTNKILVGLSVVELKDLQDNFTIQEKLDLIELVNNILINLANYSRSVGLDIPDFPDRVILINDWVGLEDLNILTSEIDSMEKRLSQVIFPYKLPRFVFWNINTDSELVNLGTCSFVGSKNKFSNRNNKLIQRVIQEEYCDLEKFVSSLDNFNLVLPEI